MARLILHVSDIHCRLHNLELLIEKYAGRVEALFLSGDIECNGGLVKALSRAGKVFAVTGNMDDQYIARLLRDNGFNVEGEVLDIGDYYVAGISGREPVNSVERVERLLEEYGELKKPLIVLAHHPPHGVVDKTFLRVHAGLYEARRLVEKYRPLLYLCGHIHEARGYARLGDTLVVNAGPLAKGYYALIDLDKLEVMMKKL